MSILTKIFEPIVSSFNKASKNVQTEEANEQTFRNSLSQAKGLDGILDAVVAEKKGRKDRAEKRAMEDKILSL